MVLKNKRIGVAMTGSFCTYTKAFEQIDRLLEEGAILQTIFSDISQHIKCRFGKGEGFSFRKSPSSFPNFQSSIASSQMRCRKRRH